MCTRRFRQPLCPMLARMCDAKAAEWNSFMFHVVLVGLASVHPSCMRIVMSYHDLVSDHCKLMLNHCKRFLYHLWLVLGKPVVSNVNQMKLWDIKTDGESAITANLLYEPMVIVGFKPQIIHFNFDNMCLVPHYPTSPIWHTWPHSHYVKTSNRSRNICNGPLRPVTWTPICNDCCLALVTNEDF
jgi:hypothetical protein